MDGHKMQWRNNLRIDEFFEYFSIKHEEDDEVETIAGLVQKLLCRMAKVNDEVKIENLKIKVLEIKGRRIKKLLVENLNEENVSAD